MIFEQLETHWVQQGNTLGAAMATKKLETEFINLKKEFVELQKLIQNLIDKHGDIEKRYEKLIQKQKRGNFKCRNGGDKFDILRKLQDHKEEGCSSKSVKQAGTELGQAQLQLELRFTLNKVSCITLMITNYHCIS